MTVSIMVIIRHKNVLSIPVIVNRKKVIVNRKKVIVRRVNPHRCCLSGPLKGIKSYSHRTASVSSYFSTPPRGQEKAPAFAEATGRLRAAGRRRHLPCGVGVALTGHPRSFAFGFSPRTQIAPTVISSAGRGLPVRRYAKARAEGLLSGFDLSGFKRSWACRRLYRRCAIAREREERCVGFFMAADFAYTP
jgi:hypothetical protein